MAAPVRYEMTAREKQIEELYLGIIARILQAKDDEAKQYRHEITHLADRVLALRSEIDARKTVVPFRDSPVIKQEYRR
jgi:hypothetical protein